MTKSVKLQKNLLWLDYMAGMKRPCTTLALHVDRKQDFKDLIDQFLFQNEQRIES